jgi:hypothetical protein
MVVSVSVILAIIAGLAAMAYANATTNSTTNGTDIKYGVAYDNGTFCFGGPHGGFGRNRCGWRFGESITVSQEFKDNVINIAKNDTDVQNLLANGYNITGVRPIIKTTVEADGTVAMKATTAIVMLSQNNTGRAAVTVNVEQAKVTRIVILTRTVIEKP